MAKDLDKNLLDTFEKFKELASNECLSAVKRAMRKSARAIQKQTVENARAGIKTYNNHPNGEYEQDSILDAVRISKLHDDYDDDEMYIKVHVMGNGKAGSKTFRFRFLEKGTKDRYAKTKKGNVRYLGRIQPRRYFKSALNTIDVEGIYINEIEKAVEKVNETA